MGSLSLADAAVLCLIQYYSREMILLWVVVGVLGKGSILYHHHLLVPV